MFVILLFVNCLHFLPIFVVICLTDFSLLSILRHEALSNNCDKLCFRLVAEFYFIL